MADAIEKLDILLSPEVDKSAIAKVNKQFESLRNSFSNILAENKGKSPLVKEMKAVEKEYKKTLTMVKKTLGVNDRSAKTIVRETLNVDKNARLPFKVAEQSLVTKKTKQWHLAQLISKSDDFEFWEKHYQKKGYKGSALTRKINSAMGTDGGYQAYKKNKEEIKEIKLKREKYKAEKKSLPFLKAMGKIGGGAFASIAKLGLVGGTAYIAARGLYKTGANAYGTTINKETYEGYSKALEETITDVTGLGSDKTKDVLKNFYGKWYGFKEAAQRGQIDQGTISQLAMLGNSDLAKTALFGNTEDVLFKGLEIASKQKDADAYNLLTKALGLPPEAAMQMLQSYRSGVFQDYYAKRQAKENVGAATGKALKTGRTAWEVGKTNAQDVVLGATDRIVGGENGAKVLSETFNPISALGDLISNIAGKNNSGVVNINGTYTNNFYGDSKDNIESATRLTRDETDINLKNAQLVGGVQ